MSTAIIPGITPYVKAIFELALARGQLDRWERCLQGLVQVVKDGVVTQWLLDPRVPLSEKLELLNEIVGDFPEAQRFVKILLTHHRIIWLPQIAQSYQRRCWALQGGLEASIISAQTLTALQQDSLLQALQRRYRSQVKLECQVDCQLIGGVVVKIAGQVIDGSVRGNLQRLKEKLLMKREYA